MKVKIQLKSKDGGILHAEGELDANLFSVYSILQRNNRYYCFHKRSENAIVFTETYPPMIITEF